MVAAKGGASPVLPEPISLHPKRISHHSSVIDGFGGRGGNTHADKAHHLVVQIEPVCGPDVWCGPVSEALSVPLFHHFPFLKIDRDKRASTSKSPTTFCWEDLVGLASLFLEHNILRVEMLLASVKKG